MYACMLLIIMHIIMHNIGIHAAGLQQRSSQLC